MISYQAKQVACFFINFNNLQTKKTAIIVYFFDKLKTQRHFAVCGRGFPTSFSSTLNTPNSQNSEAKSGSVGKVKMAEVSPITRQVTVETRELSRPPVDIPLQDVQDCLVYDRHGVSVPFKELYQDRKAVIIFVRVGPKESLFIF